MIGVTPWGTNICVEVSSAAPDADPVWVDITDYVNLPAGMTLEAWLGRATELDEPEPGHFGLLLLNRDHRFTPGNPTSPYYPWWKQSRRIRGRELLGYQAYDLFDGYVEIPEVGINLDIEGDPSTDIVVAVTGLDALGRLQNGRKMVSTLGEYILSNAGPGLKAYYPLNEDAAPFLDMSGNGYPSITPTVTAVTTLGTLTAAPQYLPGNATPPNGDDKTVMSLSTTRYDNGFGFLVLSGYASAILDLYSAGLAIPLVAGQVATIVAWARPDIVNGGVGTNFATPITAVFNDGGSAAVTVSAAYDSTGGFNNGRWEGIFTGPTELVGPAAVDSRWTAVAVRTGFSPKTAEFWIDSQTPLTGTWSATPSSLSLAKVYLPQIAFAGALCHVQIYVGAPTDYTHADFLAQVAFGQLGLVGQATGERINSILDFLGFPAGRRDIDPGVATMPNAALAGKDGLAALQEPVDTERGRLFVRDGRIVFQDRRTVYEV